MHRFLMSAFRNGRRKDGGCSAFQTSERFCIDTEALLESETINWVGFAAGGTLVAAGLLLLVGERRAGMVAAASGTALAMLNEKETLLSWWNAMPGYIDQVQRVLIRCRIPWMM
jgi:hypothetical protein